MDVDVAQRALDGDEVAVALVVRDVAFLGLELELRLAVVTLGLVRLFLWQKESGQSVLKILLKK